MSARIYSRRLEGKTALITGGTRGIGLAVARRFCEEGASVVIAGRSKDEGEIAAGQLRSEGHRGFYEPVDMADLASVKGLAARAKAVLGSINVLVNNAGTLRGGEFLRLQEETWNEVMGVNLLGAFICTQAVCRAMLEGSEQTGGSIINTTSVAGRVPKAGQVAYAVSKGGLDVLTRNAALELAEYGIRVNAVAPGLIDTDMTAGLPPELNEAIVNRTLLHRSGKPEDVTGAYVYLASDEASFVTGQILQVDGGRGFDI